MRIRREKRGRTIYFDYEWNNWTTPPQAVAATVRVFPAEGETVDEVSSDIRELFGTIKEERDKFKRVLLDIFTAVTVAPKQDAEDVYDHVNAILKDAGFTWEAKV